MSRTFPREYNSTPGRLVFVSTGISVLFSMERLPDARGGHSKPDVNFVNRISLKREIAPGRTRISCPVGKETPRAGCSLGPSARLGENVPERSEELFLPRGELLEFARVQPDSMAAGTDIHCDSLHHRFLELGAAFRAVKVVEVFQSLLFFFRHRLSFLSLCLEAALDFELCKILVFFFAGFDGHGTPPETGVSAPGPCGWRTVRGAAA